MSLPAAGCCRASSAVTSDVCSPRRREMKIDERRRDPGMEQPREELSLGYDVDENAIRFSNYFHLLRELVHLSCGWLALAPEFETKYALGDHLHDDARAVSKIRRRLYELRHPSDYPGAPADQLSALLDRANAVADTHEYLEIAYGELKPTLIAALRIHLNRL